MTTRTSGLVLIDKPPGVTSQQAVARVRKSLGGVRAGHTGTLDPFATGLLLVLIERATRLAPFVSDEPKEYEATVRFGVETDSDDATGASVRTADLPSETAVRDAITALTGDLAQVPPAFSAKHVHGVRAYALARTGAPVHLDPVRVRVESWDVLTQTRQELRARIVCSGGTYVRALARDLGRLTKSAAHCAELRRVRCGAFSVAEAKVPDAVAATDVRPPLDALIGLPIERLDDAAALGVLHGRASAATVAGDWAALVRGDAELVAVAQRDANCWQPRVVLEHPLPAPRSSLPAPEC